MEGHVRKRGDKWYYSFEIGIINGKRKRIERVGGITKKQAQIQLRKALEEYSETKQVIEISNISVCDYLDRWYNQYVLINCKYTTQRNYKLLIEKHIKPAFEFYKLKAISPDLLQEFINKKYLTGISKNHLSNIISVLSASLKYDVYPCKHIKENPMQYVKLPKYEHNKIQINHKIITQNDFNKIISRFDLNSSFHVPIMIGYYTGCRIGEVMGLTWNDVDFEKNTLNINKIIYKKTPLWYFGSTKTESSVRIIKIGKTLIDILKQHKINQMKNQLKYGEHYINQHNDNNKIISTSIKITSLPILNMICTKENGSILTPDSFKYASRVINNELGIKFNFHSLRHTHATRLIENGANIKDIQVRLGHNNIQTTLNTYIHATTKMSDHSVEIFENATK